MIVWLYVQPMEMLVCFTLCALVLYGLLLFFLRKERYNVLEKTITGALFLIWFFGVLWVTLYRTTGTRQLCLIPFRNVYLGFTDNTELFRTLFMNVLLFLPGGYLGAILLKGNRKRLFWGLVLLSVLIEAAQFTCMLGKTEVDDVLCNGLGGGLGILLWCAEEHRICKRLAK